MNRRMQLFFGTLLQHAAGGDRERCAAPPARGELRRDSGTGAASSRRCPWLSRRSCIYGLTWPVEHRRNAGEGRWGPWKQVPRVSHKKGQPEEMNPLLLHRDMGCVSCSVKFCHLHRREALHKTIKPATQRPDQPAVTPRAPPRALVSRPARCRQEA